MSSPGHTKSYYAILGLTPWANERQIRQAYRELSKLYHPDTTKLPKAEAINKFRELNDAYATLSNPERRSAYDRSIHFSRLKVFQEQTAADPLHPNSIYADDDIPSERPLSSGELFALFLLFLTFIICLVVVVLIGLVRGDRLLPDSLTLNLKNFSILFLPHSWGVLFSTLITHIA
ncbi:J domain-containing protein [Pseudanabaena sp. PCC 6802]|uniref:J domain-containing protein n=1 Tax=Pseudanabaena sp. PCC 6802 TaxID=118173 RepID=UPI00034582A4|nr:J domain-containing protein [Pseudanabaena sp. PCC 6802]